MKKKILLLFIILITFLFIVELNKASSFPMVGFNKVSVKDSELLFVDLENDFQIYSYTRDYYLLEKVSRKVSTFIDPDKRYISTQFEFCYIYLMDRNEKIAIKGLSEGGGCSSVLRANDTIIYKENKYSLQSFSWEPSDVLIQYNLETEDSNMINIDEVPLVVVLDAEGQRLLVLTENYIVTGNKNQNDTEFSIEHIKLSEKFEIINSTFSIPGLVPTYFSSVETIGSFEDEISLEFTDEFSDYIDIYKFTINIQDASVNISVETLEI